MSSKTNILTEGKPRKIKTASMIVLIAASVILVVFGFYSLVPALTTMFWLGHGAPAANWIVFLNFLGFPFVCVLAICAAWIFYSRKCYWLAMCVLLLPLINVLVFAIFYPMAVPIQGFY